MGKNFMSSNLQERMVQLLNSKLTLTFGLLDNGSVEVMVGDDKELFIVNGKTLLTAVMEAQRVRNLHLAKVQVFEGAIH